MDMTQQKPMELFTYDMVFSELNENVNMFDESYELGAILRHKEFLELQGEIEDKEEEQKPEMGEDESIYEVDHDFMTLKPSGNIEFEDSFKQAY